MQIDTTYRLIQQVGLFKFLRNDAGDDFLEGPCGYLNTQGATLLKQIEVGADAIFNLTCGQHASIERAILHRLQTNYAGWQGLNQFCDAHGIEMTLNE